MLPINKLKHFEAGSWYTNPLHSKGFLFFKVKSVSREINRAATLGTHCFFFKEVITTEGEHIPYIGGQMNSSYEDHMHKVPQNVIDAIINKEGNYEILLNIYLNGKT